MIQNQSTKLKTVSLTEKQQARLKVVIEQTLECEDGCYGEDQDGKKHVRETFEAERNGVKSVIVSRWGNHYRLDDWNVPNWWREFDYDPKGACAVNIGPHGCNWALSPGFVFRDLSCPCEGFVHLSTIIFNLH